MSNYRKVEKDGPDVQKCLITLHKTVVQAIDDVLDPIISENRSVFIRSAIFEKLETRGVDLKSLQKKVKT